MANKRKSNRVLLRIKRISLCSVAIIVFIFLYCYGAILYNRIAVAVNELFYSAGMNLRNTIIEGSVRTKRADILNMLSIDKSKSLLLFDVKTAKQRIESLPWVNQCMIAIELPDVVHVHLFEKEPVAIWFSGNNKCLIDINGDVIPCHESEIPKDMIIISGMAAAKRFGQLKRYLDKFYMFGQQVKAAVFLRSGRWDVYLKDKIVVKLPSDDVENAIRRFMKVRHRFAPRVVSAVDLRFKDVIMLKLVSGKTAKF